MRVLLTGGGTAGHINPALAIAEIIRRHDPDAVIEFVGIRTGKEADLIPREGYRLHFVQSMGIRRSLSLANVKAVWMAYTSPKARETVAILEEFQPDIVIGTGGFASWPIMKAAANRKIPTAIHESNAIPGLTVKCLQKHVDRIWVNFPQTVKGLRAKKKTVCVGNPLREGFSVTSYEEARRELGLQRGRKLLLSFGGSLGAEAINRATLALMESFSAKHPEILHVHAAGKRDFDAVKKEFEARGLSQYGNCRVVDYIYRMPVYMSAADVVISRAGAMTLSELAAMKRACILIPSPNVTDNHQYKNAKALADVGAACLVEEKTLEAVGLQAAVESLFSSDDRRKRMQKAISDFADPNVNERIWAEINALLKK
ncbi:MAG: UDP-N-acetylglucosamine--N-acetylmuramyl-(pentapeptide) pyrophosphoryl-undecaprenol N-acetylglucosamine transferase [Ruminococcaceae bacterium]|nr:UDP-N-acetylglucosamine--N-acetylmuramyl-(pentapeptide) pyrophosphoryl-undecaprenol N-acetylglucosamine transferase [Oscillospiraceae bacterium]